MKTGVFTTPELQALSAMKLPEYARVLGGILENSPHLAARTWYARPFRSTDEIHRAFTATVRALSEQEQLSLIRSHSDSFRKLSIDSDADAVAGDLARLHQRFTRRFKFPFIMRARGVTLEDMRAAMEARLTEERPLEMLTALDEICHLARERIDEMFGS